jgi:hypothetical protein
MKPEDLDFLLQGPMGGLNQPIYGGAPSGIQGCNGCTDCCHLPEIAVTTEEAERLTSIARERGSVTPTPTFKPDKQREGWQVMLGPCSFLEPGGCGIYADRPGSCRIFTCRLLLDQRRAAAVSGTLQSG